MIKLLRFLMVIAFLSKAHSQLNFTREYNLEAPIKNISLKEYTILAQKQTGLFNPSNQIFFPSFKINAFCISPLGTEIIIIQKKKFSVYRFKGDYKEKVLEIKTEFDHRIKKIIPDTFGEIYYILTEEGKLFSVSRDLNLKSYSSENVFYDIAWSNNLKSLHTISGNSLYLLKEENFDKKIEFEKAINTLTFSNNSYEIIIGDTEGNISILNQNYILTKKIQLPSKSKITSVVIHENDPHLFSTNENKDFFSINKLSDKIIKIEAQISENTQLKSIFTDYPKKDSEYILYSTDKSIKVWDASKVIPDFKKFIAQKLEGFKESFFEMKEDESKNDFGRRTDFNIASKLFKTEEQRLIDSIANTYSLGQKNIVVNNNEIDVEIPPFEKVKIFSNSNLIQSQLSVSEVHYDINKKNNFYIKSLKVNNPDQREPLTYNPIQDKKSQDSINKVNKIKIQKERKAIAIAKEISKQESELKNNLANLIQNLQKEDKIKEVDLSVDSKIILEKDSTGEEELNLKINFISKGVKAQIGANTSDYPPGKYNLLNSPSAKTLVEFFLKSTEENLVEYLNPGTRVTFKLTGSTDNSKISSSIPYMDDFGEFNNFPYYFQGSLNGMNLDSKQGITSNSQLGFLRTFSVRDFINNYTDLFDSTKNKFIHYSEEADDIGSEYRKIEIEMTIHSIDKLMSLKKDNQMSLSDVDVDIPSGNKKVNGYAIVIGNEDYASYQSDLDTSQNVPFADKDAESFKNYLNIMYGIPSENIILLVNATYGEMSQGISKFKKLMEFDGEGNNFIFYYSGHGMPHEQTNDPYIMPVDISGYTVDQAISLNDLLSGFKDYNYDKLTMILDACFSGVSRSPEPLIKVKGVGNRRIKDKVKENSKSKQKSFDFQYIIQKLENEKDQFINPNIGDNMLLISSSSGEETSLTDNDNKHGLFTYYFLKFLKESKGDLSIESLFKKVRKKVGIESIMKYNKPQTPEIIFGKNVDIINESFPE